MGDEKISRAILAAALVAGASYMLAGPLGIMGVAAIVWKGAGVALLALWSAGQARELDGWLIAVVMACGALGDVLLEAAGLSVGAVAFLLGHLTATVLYTRNRRADTSTSQRILAIALAIATPQIAWVFTRDIGATVYAGTLGAMAGLAWLSRFPRYRTGIGAVMFVASDLLIFARMGPLAASALAGWLIWPLYFAGQVLVAIGVTRTLAGQPLNR